MCIYIAKLVISLSISILFNINNRTEGKSLTVNLVFCSVHDMLIINDRDRGHQIMMHFSKITGSYPIL